MISFYTFLTFFYGSVGGALSCILFFFMVFRKIEVLLANTVRKKARKHAEFDAVAKEAASISPAKVETLCKMVRFDDGIVSDAIQCRMVFYSGTIDIYAVDELRTLSDHRQEVVKEHLLGRISRSCVIATGERISKYHRHRNQSTQYSAIKGKCTILKHKEDLPLFIEDPGKLLKERLAAIRKEQHQQVAVERLRRHAKRDGVTLTEEQVRERLRDMELATEKQKYLHDLATATGSAGCAKGMPHLPADIKRRQQNRYYSTRDRRDKRGRYHSSGDSSYVAVENVPLSQWTCLAIKFPTRRVQERWLNLLQATPLTTQWHDFIRHLPKMDVFNLLVARLFFENSRANTLHDLLEEKLNKKLTRVSKSLGQRLRGNIYLDALDVGGEIPLISNVSNPTASDCGDTEFDFDMLYRGGFALKIRFAILYRDIRVPDIVFSIKVLELAGRMRFVVGPPPSKNFWLGCPKAPQLRLEFTQEVASHDGLLNAVLKLLPDMSQIASNVVKSMLFEDMVFPNLDDFPWPVLGEDNDSESENEDGSEQPTVVSDVEELQEIHSNDSRNSARANKNGSNEKGREESAKVNGQEIPKNRTTPLSQSPREPPRKVVTVQAASTFDTASSPISSRNVHFSGSNAGASPPPRPPPSPLSSSQREIEVPTRHSSSTGNLNGSVRNTAGDKEHRKEGDHISPPTFPPPPPTGLPPRPPRVASASFSKQLEAPSTRAPGSSSPHRVPSPADFKEPDE